MTARNHILRRKRLYLGLGALGVLLLVVYWNSPRTIDRWTNGRWPPAYAAKLTAEAATIHRSLFIVDLHADSLLWRRNLLVRSDRGHLDLPRLIEGNIAIQVFSVVTKAPLHTKLPPLRPGVKGTTCRRPDGFDGTILLRIAQGLPPGQWFDQEAAALGQAQWMLEMIEASRRRHEADPRQPFFKLILTAEDLARVIELRQAGKPVVGALLSLEGVHWIAPDQPNAARDTIKRLFDAGFRMVAPTHQFHNNLGASSTGCGQAGGLTPLGSKFLKTAEQQGMLLDLAHSSDQAVLEAADQSRRPIIVSHTGIRRYCAQKRHCNLPRNAGDAQIRAVARTGGLIAIGHWKGAIGGHAAHGVQAFDAAHAVLNDAAFRSEMQKKLGRFDPLEHLAFGSDFDGGVKMPFDVTGLSALTSQLLSPYDRNRRKRDRSFDVNALRRIAGANACRVLATALPRGGPDAARRICKSVTPDAVGATVAGR